jgi:hypothetical protein
MAHPRYTPEQEAQLLAWYGEGWRDLEADVYADWEAEAREELGEDWMREHQTLAYSQFATLVAGGWLDLEEEFAQLHLPDQPERPDIGWGPGQMTPDEAYVEGWIGDKEREEIQDEDPSEVTASELRAAIEAGLSR